MTNLRSDFGARLPVSVLTGFRDSGKTTVVDHLVRDPAMRRLLVVVNEFGRSGSTTT